jgi:hypothetical protein
MTRRDVLRSTLAGGLAGAVGCGLPSGILDHESPGIRRTPETILAYLKSLGESDRTSGKLISGHWCGGSFSPEIKVDWSFRLDEVRLIREITGKWVGLISCWLQPGYSAWHGIESVDTQMWYDAIKAGFQEYWDAGGLLHAGASFSCPLASHYGDRYYGREEGETVPTVAELLTPGTGIHARWMAMLERIADFFVWCDRQGMVVIWRPFTELYLSQFWYGKLGDDGFRQLWWHMHHYFTETRGIRCLLWEFNGRNRHSSYEPGFVHTDQTGSRPWAQGELGRQTDYVAWVEKAKRVAPYMTYFLTWDRGSGPAGQSGDGSSPGFNMTYREALQNPWVLNRDELAGVFL